MSPFERGLLLFTECLVFCFLFSRIYGMPSTLRYDHFLLLEIYFVIMINYIVPLFGPLGGSPSLYPWNVIWKGRKIMSGDVLGREIWPLVKSVFLKRTLRVITIFARIKQHILNSVHQIQLLWISVGITSIVWYDDIITFEYFDRRVLYN